MSKILYFCNCDLRMKNGHGLMIRAHHRMLTSLYPDKVITVMMPDEPCYYDYVCFNHASQVEKFFAVLTGYSPDLSLKTIGALLTIIEKEDVKTVFIESSMFGNLVKKIKKFDPSINVVTYFTDIEADLLNQEMKNCNTKRRAVIRRLIQNEYKTVKFADKKFVLNKRDAEIYYNYYGQQPDAIIPIIIDKANFEDGSNMHTAYSKLRLLFVGGDFWPNVAGIRWFVESVIPKISSPCELTIVGLGMEKYRDELESKSSCVHVVGTVDDLKPYFVNSDLFVAPIKDGGGMKVKTAEALSYGKTFIGMEESLIGYWEFVPQELKGDGVIQCIDESEMANCIDSYYGKTFSRCRKDIKDFIDALCGYEENLERFKKLF